MVPPKKLSTIYLFCNQGKVGKLITRVQKVWTLLRIKGVGKLDFPSVILQKTLGIIVI